MQPETRTERDSLGSLKIPKDAYYGIQSFRASRNFPISGTQVHPELIRSYLLLKKAAALTHISLKAIDVERGSAIVHAVDSLLKEDFLKYFIVDAYQAGAGTSQNMNVNEVIANRANELLGKPLGSYDPVHPNDHVNRSQSTNDSYPTAMRLASVVLSKKLFRSLYDLELSLDRKAQEFDGILKSARTHLQDAVPIRLGQEFSGYRDTVRALLSLLAEAQNHLRELGIGGSAAGTGINVPKYYRSKILEELKKLFGDLDLRPAANLFTSMQSQLPSLIYSNSLRAIASELSRICSDLRLMSSGPSTGLGEIHLPEVQPGSSIMAGKVNPSILEMANQVCFKVLGDDLTVALSVQAGQLELNVMMPVIAQASLEATDLLTHMIDTLRTRCIDGIEANRERCRDFAEHTSQIATALNPVLGYEQVAEIAKEAVRTNQSVIALVREKKLLSESQLQGLLDPKKLTEPPEA